ncbi:hypothetical protein [Streptomyces decoyicus]|uniref:hypothetical protein n=1 Tax=Streptomyces decoyicus TaxID=249567 RepID=UPI00380B2307
MPGPRRPGRHLASVPASGQPSDGGLGDALRLGRGTRLRLLAAVRALLADPSVAGLKDAPKLATVVLYAKSRAPKGEKNDLQTSIWGAELGRWLGVKESTVHHKVLPVLRDSGALRTRVVTDAKGHPTGLDCLVMPLWNARKNGGAGHPLALSKAELAVLLRLIEALFGHGWTPKAKAETLPGLLAGRRGKGAATDRLGLLLMVLNTRASGWLQLCGGSVKKREGRGAATLARLLGCSPAGARKVLARLTEVGVVARQRRATETRMKGRGRVMLLPVARAYGQRLASLEGAHDSQSVFSARPDGAVGDHAPVPDDSTLGASADLGAEGIIGVQDQERPDDAEFHATHAPVVTPVIPPQLSGRFSGVACGDARTLPGHVHAREDAAAAEPTPAPEDGPLRGEKPKPPITIPTQQKHDTPAADTGTSTTRRDPAGQLRAPRGRDQSSRLRPRVPRPPRDLETVVAPVQLLWARLERGGARRRVEKAIRRELRAAASIVGRERAADLLTERLNRRLLLQPGEADAVTDPVGWLLGRGLPQRTTCGDARCDEGAMMHTGTACERCDELVSDRRSRRRRLAAAVDAEHPEASADGRRQALEERLRSQARRDGEAFERRRQAAEELEARREAARAKAEEKAERERAVVEAAEVVRQARPCADCGAPRSGGRCEACGYQGRTEDLVTQTAFVAATWAADRTDRDDVAAVTAHVRADLADAMNTAREQFLELMDPGELHADPAATASAMAFAGLMTVQRAAAEYRSNALANLARGPEAEAEAKRAYATEKARRQHRWSPDGPVATAAAEKAARVARERTAQHLLTTRLQQLHGLEGSVVA